MTGGAGEGGDPGKDQKQPTRSSCQKAPLDCKPLLERTNLVTFTGLLTGAANKLRAVKVNDKFTRAMPELQLKME